MPQYPPLETRLVGVGKDHLKPPHQVITDCSLFLTQACRRLIGRAFALHELPSLVEAIFSSKDEADAIRCLPGDGAQTFIDVIDEACSTLTYHPKSIDWN